MHWPLAVVVRVARDTGRPVLEVAHESFALTLYTLFHLQQLARVEQHDRQMERFDLAALVTHAMWKPERLKDLEAEYLARVKAEDAERMQAERRTRAAKLHERLAAHERMTLVRTDVPR